MISELIKTFPGMKDGLLIGVTGGIAVGKTAVSRMLEEMGAPAIDFDVLSRQVVEPGKPAFKEITDWFGKEAVAPDGTLDRAKISQIVFRDAAQRRKLESIIHPAAFQEFVRQVELISGRNPRTVVQAVVPLLYEVNMQPIFDKIVVVCVSRETQLERLMKRDGIGNDAASARLKAQMPIEEKKKLGDYIINNESSLENTMQQVRDLWKILIRSISPKA